MWIILKGFERFVVAEQCPDIYHPASQHLFQSWHRWVPAIPTIPLDFDNWLVNPTIMLMVVVVVLMVMVLMVLVVIGAMLLVKVVVLMLVLVIAMEGFVCWWCCWGW